MRRVTSSDVAKLAGVSQSTVSLIMNNSRKISFSNETRERVFAAARQLGYSVPAHSRVQQDDMNRKLIFVLTPTMTNQYYTELTQYIEQYADARGYHVMFCNTFRDPELEKYYIDISAIVKVEGIIYTFLPSFPRMVEQMSQKTPVVLIGEKGDDLAISSIELSNLKAGNLVISHLLQLGHRNFAYVSTPINSFTLSRQQRLVGIKAKLKEYGLENNLEVMCPESGEEYDRRIRPYEYDTGYTLVKEKLKGESKITAFIGANDMTAIGIIAAIQEMGKAVPKDYSVCGFDNIFTSIISSPTLTTVDHHQNIRAKVAVDMILSTVESKTKHSGNIYAPLMSKIEYDPQLIVRESTGSR